LVLLFLIVAAAAQQIPDADGVQEQITPRIPYNARVQYGLPQQVWDFLEGRAWGDFHLAFHMARKYYVIGTQARQWLDNNKIKPAPFQEGDPNNGIEFLAMHRAMIEYLRQRFGSLPVTNDPDGRRTVNEVLDGWKTDDEAIQGLGKFNGNVATFRAGLVNINNFNQFKSEDEFGLFLQTGMRLIGQLDPANPSRRRYNNDPRPGAGVHNWMHGQLMDDNSPITVGDPRTNLPNILFWRIHGWIENKWKQWEAARPRTSAESQLYNGLITQFRAHMIGMSGGQTMPPATIATTTRATTRPTTTTRRATRPPRRRTGWFLQGLNSDLESAETNLFRDASTLSRDARRYDRDAHRVVDIAHRFADRDRFLRYAERVQSHTRSLHHVRVPFALVIHLRSKKRWFRNNVFECHALADGVVTDLCPNGNRSPDLPDRREVRRQMRRANLSYGRRNAHTTSRRASSKAHGPRVDEPPQYAADAFPHDDIQG